MNKKDIVTAVAERSELSKADSEKALDAILKTISDSLKKGEEVRLVGFGTFLVSKRAAKKGVNPQTGKPIDIPAANVPKFRPGKILKESLN